MKAPYIVQTTVEKEAANDLWELMINDANIVSIPKLSAKSVLALALPYRHLLILLR